MSSATLRISIVLLAIVSHAIPQSRGVTIRLSKEWMETYKDTILIDTPDFMVDKVHKRPNSPAKDGDLHVAGRANDSVLLPVVAEVANAKFVPKTVQAIKDAEGTETPLRMEGVWRLWCEHSGISKQDQSQKAPTATTTNPDHVFEIHPVTKVGNQTIVKATFKGSSLNRVGRGSSGW